MGIFSKYLRAHKVEGLPTTNIEREALYIVGDGKSETFMIAVRNRDNNQWHILKETPTIPNTNNKLFIGDNDNPLDTPTIAIDTQDLMQGYEIVITYKRDGQVELPLIESSRPDVKIYLQSINNSVNFEGNGALNRIYLHLMEVVGGDTYYFDITAGKIDTYTNV